MAEEARARLHSVRIRQAKAEDLNAIFSMILVGIETGKVEMRSQKDLNRHMDSFYVVEEKSRVIACCAIEIFNQRLAELRSLAFHPGCMKKEVFVSLVEHCLAKAAEKKVRLIFTVTTRESPVKHFGCSEWKASSLWILSSILFILSHLSLPFIKRLLSLHVLKELVQNWNNAEKKIYLLSPVKMNPDWERGESWRKISSLTSRGKVEQAPLCCAKLANTGKSW